MKVGVISDTHGVIRPGVLVPLQGSDLIIHAGDVGSPTVLEALRAIAPVIAVRGNCDKGEWARMLPLTEIVQVGSVPVCIVHDLGDLDLNPASAGIGAVISGHSHDPLLYTKAGVIYLNPGSAGPRRFKLPTAVARMQIDRGLISAEVVILEEGN